MPCPKGGRRHLARLYLLLATVITVPAVALRISGTHLAPHFEAILFGAAIFGAAFLLSWAAEVAQKDIAQGLAVAILALIAVLPEYAVDVVLAWKAGKDPQYGHYALANMTGANRLLVGFGWALIVLLYGLRHRKWEVKLAPAHRTEILFLGLATCYSVLIPLKGRLDLMDTFFLLLIFSLYAVRVMKAEVHEPELVGPALWLGGMPTRARRAACLLLFLVSGFVIFIAAERFAESLIATGKIWGIDEFLLVQWLAPLASESPEFIVASIWALRGDAQAGLGALLSSKVNQWTLLVGTLAIVYSFSLGAPGALPLDGRQTHEMWLTAAQSLFAVAILVNLSLSWHEALMLFVLFASQYLYEHIRMKVSAVYVVLALIFFWRYRRLYPALLKSWRAG